MMAINTVAAGGGSRPAGVVAGSTAAGGTAILAYVAKSLVAAIDWGLPQLMAGMRAGEPVTGVLTLVGGAYVLTALASGLLLGPIFSSAGHGYDSLDQLSIDPRLGGDADFDDLDLIARVNPRLGRGLCRRGAVDPVRAGPAAAHPPLDRPPALGRPARRARPGSRRGGRAPAPTRRPRWA